MQPIHVSNRTDLLNRLTPGGVVCISYRVRSKARLGWSVLLAGLLCCAVANRFFLVVFSESFPPSFRLATPLGISSQVYPEGEYCRLSYEISFGLVGVTCRAAHAVATNKKT